MQVRYHDITFDNGRKYASPEHIVIVADSGH